MEEVIVNSTESNTLSANKMLEDENTLYRDDAAIPEVSATNPEVESTAIHPTMTINGLIQDARTSELISGATIYLKSDRTNSTFSNDEGRFTLDISIEDIEDIIGESKEDTLVITNAGYQKFSLKITIGEDSDRHIKIKKKVEKTDRALKDHELVNLALGGDQRAYGKLMGRYRDSIYFMIQKMVNNKDDAEDLTIEAFGKAFNNLQKYSPDYAFSTWLYRIAINNCIDFIRKKRLETFSLDEPMDSDGEDGSGATRDVQSSVLDPEEEIIKKQRILLMRNVIEKLNSKYRRLIELRYLKELSYQEISETLNLPLGTVKAQLFRAKELLHNILQNSKERY
ncbi:MAG: sigma-70 family RNA polymerase sigma factor [Chitinophagales bacterium]